MEKEYKCTCIQSLGGTISVEEDVGLENTRVEDLLNTSLDDDCWNILMTCLKSRSYRGSHGGIEEKRVRKVF